MGERRLRAEWKVMQMSPPPLCYAEPTEEDIFQWNAAIMGPPGSPYQGAVFLLKIHFKKQHPFSPPKIRFIFPIYHPNVDENGKICMDMLGSQWGPALYISTVLIAISSVLSEPLFDGIPFNLDAAKMYETDRENYNKIARNSCHNYFSLPEYQHLHFKLYFWQLGNSRKKLIKYMHAQEEKPIEVEDLCYPNDKLYQNFEIYEKQGSTFIPLKTYKMAKRRYPLIKAAEDGDIKKWIKFMAKTRDNKFVEDNIEFRICSDFKNERLWELYFQFLKEFDQKKLLQIYALQCRFNPDNEALLKEYKEAVVSYGPSLIPWKNTFDFEIYDENVKFATFSTENKTISCHFSSNNASIQNLPFKLSLMDYILKASSPKNLQNLHMTCKYLFIRLPTPVCYKLEILNKPTNLSYIEFKESSAKISNLQSLIFKNIRLSTILSVNKTGNDLLGFSKCLTKIRQCDAKYIYISHQNLTETEVKFLISSKNVVELMLKNTNIGDDNDGDGIMLEEILQFTPKIKQLSIDSVKCNPQTSRIISELIFTQKIEYFRLEKLPDESLEPNDFFEFIKKNFTGRGSIALRFLPNVGGYYIMTFRNTVKNRIDQELLVGCRPNLKIF